MENVTNVHIWMSQPENSCCFHTHPIYYWKRNTRSRQCEFIGILRRKLILQEGVESLFGLEFEQRSRCRKILWVEFFFRQSWRRLLLHLYNWNPFAFLFPCTWVDFVFVQIFFSFNIYCCRNEILVLFFFIAEYPIPYIYTYIILKQRSS